jgi:ABC-type multidrug transport system fused ATPase/permease subunit
MSRKVGTIPATGEAEMIVTESACNELPWWFTWNVLLLALAEVLIPIFVVGFADKTHSISMDEVDSYTFSENLIDLYSAGALLLLGTAICTRYMCIPIVACTSLGCIYALATAKGILYKHFDDPLLAFIFAWIVLCATMPQLIVLWCWYFDMQKCFKSESMDDTYILLQSDEEGLIPNTSASGEPRNRGLDSGNGSRVSTFYRFARVKYRAAGRRSLPLGKAGQEKRHASVGRLLWWTKSEWKLLVLATIALAISSFAGLVQPMYFGMIIQTCIDSDPDEKRLSVIACTLLVVFAIGAVSGALQGYLYGVTGERLARNIRTELFSAILGQDIAFFDANKTGELMNRLASDTATIQSTLSVNMSVGFRAVGTIIVSLALLFITSWELTFIMLAVVPVLTIIASVYGNFTRKYTQEYQDALAAAADFGNEAIHNVRVVRSYGAEELERKRYTESIQVSYEKGKTKAIAGSIFQGGAELLGNCSILCVIYFGAVMVSQNKLELGQLTSFIMYTIYIALSLGEISGLYTQFMTALGASEKIFSILDTIPTIPTRGGIWPSSKGKCVKEDDKRKMISTNAGLRNRGQWDEQAPFHTSVYAQLISDEHGNLPSPEVSAVWKQSSGASPPRRPAGEVKIRIENVRFTYALRNDVEVLKGFDLTIRENQRVALVGASGSGKSTVLALLQRFYDVDPGGGCIKIDDTDIRKFDPLYLRRAIGIVPQEPILFSGSIRSNILYSRHASEPALFGSTIDTAAADRDVERFAKQAHAHEFITSFSDGYDTIVGERGVRLSRGQKQRIAIARALLANPSILLLDEAASALDTESEKLVQDAINRLMINRTTILIAHRLSTVRDADVIAMCDNGRMLASGTHDDLMESCEPYVNLVKGQMQW